MGQVPLETGLIEIRHHVPFADQAMDRRGPHRGQWACHQRPGLFAGPGKSPHHHRWKTSGPAAACTIMLYKPRGIVTTRSDEKGRKTVYDLLPAHLQHLASGRASGYGERRVYC